MPDILITENISGPPIDRLKSTFQVQWEPEAWKSPERLSEIVGDTRAWIVRNQTQVTAELLDAAGLLQIVARCGVGLDNIDTEAATNAGIVVTYTPQANSVSVAELTVGLMLSLARRIPAAHAHTQQGNWSRLEYTGAELLGKTLGLVGLGRIGVLTATRARAFGMLILAHDKFLDPSALQREQLEAQLVGLEELLSQSDVVSCHVPLTGETAGMMDYERFCQMKHTALFVNTSRGEVVDETGLIRALREGCIAGAALDVRSEEPPASGPLNDMDNVILTPHIAAFTDEAQSRVLETVADDVADILRGGSAVNYVNIPTPGRA